MSRIQEILNKAEREGTARRTRGLSDHQVPPAPAARTPLRAERAVLEPSAPWMPGTTAPALETNGAVASPAFDGHLVAAIAPQSSAAERYRLLRTRIKQAAQGRQVRSIVITSPAMGDGKSLTASNLALTMAQEFHQRVLLIDGDLRRPAIARLFGLGAGPGLTEVLMGVASIDSALVHLPDQHLTILPAGAPSAQPAELLGSASMRRVLDTLATRFDRILVDMPPVAPLADVHVIAPLIDALLVVVRAGSTPTPAIERALTGLDPAKVLGLVLNAANEADAYGYTSEGYGYIAG